MAARLLRTFDAVFPAPAALALAVVGAAVSAATVATTLAPGGPYAPEWVIWPLFLGIFPVHFRSVRTLLLERAEFKDRVLGTPRVLLVPAAALAVCAFALSMQAVFTMRGNPERHGTAYYLDNHGALTRVSRSEYRYAERKLERLFIGGALVFYLTGILVHFPAGTPRGRVVAARG